MNEGSIGVIISTYNNPRWLEKTLWGYLYQTHKPDEILIADDGSGEDTFRVIESFKDKLPIKHLWHEDQGFRKTRILNIALLEAKSDYLIFTDQDCIPRRDFVEVHRLHAKEGQFLSGGYFRLPLGISVSLGKDDISTGRAFSLAWLRNKGLPLSIKCMKLTRFPFDANSMNKITTARSTWNGMNASGWREDLLAVNGFNEEMRYEGEDRELGIRMNNYGIKSRQIRYSAIVLHLDHKRPYKNQEDWDKNLRIIQETKKTRRIKTPFGLNLHQEASSC